MPGVAWASAMLALPSGGETSIHRLPDSMRLIYHYPEAKLVDVETQAAILIANKNHDEVQAEIGILLVQAQERSVNTKRYGRIVHPRNYKGGKQQTLGEFCS